MKQPEFKYRFYASLLDSFTEFLDVKAEEFFYKDEKGDWHVNMNQDGELHFSEEEVHQLAKQQFIDNVNRVDEGPSEAADKGTAFNEIVDCIVMKTQSTRDDVVIKSIKEPNDESSVPCIKAEINGFKFLFDQSMCIEAGSYFYGSVCQLQVSAPIETKYGTVELYGYPDYIKENKVYDLKTTKQYQFGKYEKKWQKHVYPYALITSGKMTDVKEFEYTCYKLCGGTSRTPIITGVVYPEVYTFDFDTSKNLLTQHCERLIEFLEQNRDQITDKKVFALSD